MRTAAPLLPLRSTGRLVSVVLPPVPPLPYFDRTSSAYAMRWVVAHVPHRSNFCMKTVVAVLTEVDALRSARP